MKKKRRGWSGGGVIFERVITFSLTELEGSLKQFCQGEGVGWGGR